METLRLFDSGERWQLEEAFEVLEGYAVLFGDNGGDPDGNAWLPSQPLDDSVPEVARLLNQGKGELVNAFYYAWEDLTALADTLGIRDVLYLANEHADWQAFRNAVADRVYEWAHYGAYGAGDEVWVIRFL